MGVAGLQRIRELGTWPLELSREQAAAYVGVSTELFDREVRAGIWPKGWRRGRGGRITWNRLQLEHARQQHELNGTSSSFSDRLKQHAAAVKTFKDSRSRE